MHTFFPALFRYVLVVLLALATSVVAQKEPAAPDAEPKKAAEVAEEAKAEIPPARTTYKGREIAQTMHWMGASWLLRKTREREEAAQEMLRELRLKPGMTVCDLGCGNGYHSLVMAKTVSPGGKVLGVDIQQEMLDMLQDRAKKEGITNIVSVLGDFHDPKLKPNTVDLVLIVDAYHEFSHPELMLKALHRALKPKGQVVLVEFRAEDKSVPIKPEHKMSKKQIKKELLPNGFELVREYDKLPWQHLMFFGKASP